MNDSLLQLNDNPIGLMPKGWTMGSLADVCDIRNEKADPKALTDVRYVGLEHIDSSSPILSRWGSNADVRSAKSCFYPGDILYGKLRPYLQEAALAHFAGICSTDVLVLRANRRALSEWLIFLFHTDGFVRHAISTTAGTNLPRTSWTAIKEIRIPIPPLPEQRRIAHILSTIQRAIQAQDAVITAARELKRSLMHRLFTYGPYAEPLPTKETEIGEVPEGWEIQQLGNLADIEYGIQAAVAALTDPTVGVPILTNINLTLDCTIDYSLLRYYPLSAKESGKLLQSGDVLFNWRSGSQHHVGKTAIFKGRGPFTFSSFILRFRASKSVTNEFLARHLNRLWSQGYFVKQRSQSSVNSVFNKSAAFDIPVLVPSDTEQSAMASVLEIADEKLDAEIRRKTALEALFKSMLHQLMTGQVHVPPADFGSRRSSDGLALRVETISCG